MSGTFSGIVRISNISDFIEPSQKCVLPIQNGRNQADEGKNLVVLHPKSQIKAQEKVKISLNDCLACSGCITTAESILIESQTIDHMLSHLNSSKYSVVAISPQSLCSLAAKFQLENKTMARLISSYFKSKGANFIVDMSFARILSRKLHYEQFKREFLTSESGELNRRTILSGVCPGFVCYAEKTHGDFLVPLLSSVRSPQAILGQLIKNFICKKLSVNCDEVFLVAVQPCFDKKLEASRMDFTMDGGQQEVDCVVTPVELEPLLADYIQNEQILENHPTDDGVILLPEVGWLHTFESGTFLGEQDAETSGGYAEYIAQKIIQEYKGAVTRREKISKDFELLHIEFEEGSQPKLFTLAKAYGFRNIQNLVQRLKRNKLKAHFVEVMACPSGCANGAGQIRAEKSEQRAELLARVQANYERLGSEEAGAEAATQWDQIEEEWAKQEPRWRENATHTQYRPVKSSNASLSSILNSW